MKDHLDYYDVEAMIRDARSEIRGEIDNAVRDACRHLQSVLAEELRELREQVASALVSGGTLP